MTLQISSIVYCRIFKACFVWSKKISLWVVSPFLLCLSCSSHHSRMSQTWSQPIRESALGQGWHGKQREKQKKLLLKPVFFSEASVHLSQHRNTQYCLMKDRKNKMTSNEASTANLPNIIFYSVGGKKKGWQNMMRKKVWDKIWGEKSSGLSSRSVMRTVLSCCSTVCCCRIHTLLGGGPTV